MTTLRSDAFRDVSYETTKNQLVCAYCRASINLRTHGHGHGQGYLDLNFLIPKLVERVDFRKGPYCAATGDFSVAGSARYSTYDSLERDFIEVAVGAFGYLRGVAAGDIQLSENTNLLLAVEGLVSEVRVVNYNPPNALC